MKATLEFNLPEDRADFIRASKANDMAADINDVMQATRGDRDRIMKKESDTPRTDKAWGEWPYSGPGVGAMFARELERENNRLRAALEEIRDTDYHGNRCGCSQIAEKALREL